MRAVFEDQGVMFWVFGVVQWACLFAPFLFIFTAPKTVWQVVATQIVVIYLIRAILAARFKNDWLSVLLHPLGIFLTLLIGFNSWRKTVGKGVEWKGRIYKPLENTPGNSRGSFVATEVGRILGNQPIFSGSRPSDRPLCLGGEFS